MEKKDSEWKSEYECTMVYRKYPDVSRDQPKIDIDVLRDIKKSKWFSVLTNTCVDKSISVIDSSTNILFDFLKINRKWIMEKKYKKSILKIYRDIRYAIMNNLYIYFAFW